MVFNRQLQSILLCCALAFSTFAQGASQAQEPAPGGITAADFQELVAPIALYPDALVSQILAASTYPTQVVEADRWVRDNSSLKGKELAQAIDKQAWDPSVKGLAQFSSVLHNMSQNLSWTSSLGDAYFNAPKEVMAAVQHLRKQAEKAGHLESTQQQTVTTEGDTIVIQPAEPEVVYVPSYGPEIYGGEVPMYPGYSGWDVAAASAISFGVGALVGAASGGYGWGWGHWGANWHGGDVTFNRNTYVSRSNTFASHNTRFSEANRANVNRGAAGGSAFRSGTAGAAATRPNAQNFNAPAARERPSQSEMRGFDSRGSGNSAFGGFNSGGFSAAERSRGSSSFGGGGRSFGGGGGRMGGGGGRRR